MPGKLIPSRHLRVGRSRSGLGLFTRVHIKKGQFIVRYTGRKIPDAKAEKLTTRYMFEVNSRWTIDGSNRHNLARYINHSCRPNCEVYFAGHVIKIRALRNIKPETELSYTYGRDYLDSFIRAKGCKCTACVNKRRALRAEQRRKRLRAAKRRARS
jgi:SET domain-containing protein